MAFTHYTIVPEDGVVVLDHTTAYQPVDMSGIPLTVHAIQWDGVEEVGRIEYKELPDGTLPIPGSFTDPNDYYNQTQACESPLVCYSTSDTSVYDGKTYTVGQELIIYQWPNPAVPSGFTATVPPAQTLDYTSLYWTGVEFIWSLFDPLDTLAEAKDTSAKWVQNYANTNLLLFSDWYVIRFVETSIPVPTDWANWRTAIRAEVTAKVADIAAFTDLQDLYDYTVAPAFNTWSPSP